MDFRKVRHKNVVQFIGASTKPPNLCIVTGMVEELVVSSCPFSCCDGNIVIMSEPSYFPLFQNLCPVEVCMITSINIKVFSNFLL